MDYKKGGNPHVASFFTVTFFYKYDLDLYVKKSIRPNINKTRALVLAYHEK